MDERVSSRPVWLSHFDVAEAFEALRSDQCRAVLRALDGGGGRLQLAELADAVLARDWGAPAGPAGAEDTVRRRTLIDLHHTTLPKLDGHDVVSYDPDSTVVTLTSAGESLLPLVEHVDHAETRR